MITGKRKRLWLSPSSEGSRRRLSWPGVRLGIDPAPESTPASEAPQPSLGNDPAVVRTIAAALTLQGLLHQDCGGHYTRHDAAADAVDFADALLERLRTSTGVRPPESSGGGTGPSASRSFQATPSICKQEMHHESGY